MPRVFVPLTPDGPAEEWDDPISEEDLTDEDTQMLMSRTDLDEEQAKTLLASSVGI